MPHRIRVGLIMVCVPLVGLLGCQTAPTSLAPSAAFKRTPLPTDAGVPVKQWYMNTEDEVVHYVAEYGTETKPGNVVVVLHGGWGAEHSYLLPAIRPLADEYKFVLYDQRGSLRSPVRPPAKITYAALVEDLEQLRQRLGLEKITLMAHSMGNHLAYGYLRAHPERVAGLVLVGATVPAPFGEQRPAFLSDVWPDFADADAEAIAARQKHFDDGILKRTLRIAADEGIIPIEAASATPETVKSFGLQEIIKTDQQKTDWWRIQFTCVNTHNGRNWREMLGGQVFYNGEAGQAVLEDPEYQAATRDFWRALRSFTGPIRVIIGTDDYVDLGPTMWPRLVAHLPTAKLDAIPNAGHSIWMDEPKRFRRSLRAALGATTARTTEPRPR
ncbi:MAG: alpha/beta hydrolase [Phycisphaerales bacterium]|nr:alpha/beta hydrolase [Phycisphaerales bacterium]